ncbi:hypothetical protein ACWFNE_16910 [Cellulomonas sp. NPDC055163]
MSTHDARRPPSPWTGSSYEIRHHWQLDPLTSLPALVAAVRDLAAEVVRAHDAGWRLTEPMRSGHLLAVRPSRRQRARSTPPTTPGRVEAPPLPGWRLRLVDEPAAPGEDVLDCDAVPGTPVLRLGATPAEQLSGPGLPRDVLAEVSRQTVGLDGRWALVTARVGSARDLVAHGSALRLHAVSGGALVRTREVLTFQHAADGAATLLQAAAAYERLADTAQELVGAGGRLDGADGGFVHVRLPAAR